MLNVKTVSLHSEFIHKKKPIAFIICEVHLRTTYGQLSPRRNMTDGELKSLMEKFAYNNPGIAVKNRTTKAVVAQFVSNCGSKSDRLASFIIHIIILNIWPCRETLLKSLSKHIPVDVYGACGTLKCERYNLVGFWICLVVSLGPRRPPVTRCWTTATSSTWLWRTACVRTTSLRSSLNFYNTMLFQVQQSCTRYNINVK